MKIELASKIFNRFMRKTQSNENWTPNKRYMYVVTHGELTGEFLLFFPEETHGDSIAALAFPDVTIKYIEKKDIIHALNEGVLDRSTKVPKKYYNFCLGTFRDIKKRTEQKKK